MAFDNILTLTDSYKVSHAVQYPKNTHKIYSYFESRGGEFRSTVFFGLQYLLKRYLSGEVVTKEKIDRAEHFLNKHLGPGLFQRARWEHILLKHGGKLPVSIHAIPEGSVVPTKNVLMTIENTDDECFWLTNYLETLLVQVWYPSTTATISREMKSMISNALVKSGTPELIDFKLHDFGFRGVSSVESAALGGAGHLVNFKGTDTLAALELLEQYYGEEMAGFSIPAAEHSTITSWGKEDEVKAYENMLTQFPKGLVAVVSDSWDIFNAVKHLWGGALRDKVMQRDGTLVIRPDSGDPTQVLPELLKILGSRFEYVTNSKGYKVLNSKIRLIQGDGIRRSTLQSILDAVMASGWSIDNLAFGSGGGLLQDCNRDTQNFAFKCSYMEADGKSREVFKNPVGASWKASKKGKLTLAYDSMFENVHGSKWATLGEDIGLEDKLVEVFRNGELLSDWNLEGIRKRAAL